MKKKIILASVGILFILAGVFGIYFKKDSTEKSSSENSEITTPVVDLDAIMADPEKYQHIIGVAGTVVNEDKSSNIFLLGCEDNCCVLPVKYTHQFPKVKSQIVVYGKVVKQKDNRYIFEGSNLKTN